MSFVPGTHFYRQKTKYTKPAPNPVPTSSYLHVCASQDFCICPPKEFWSDKNMLLNGTISGQRVDTYTGVVGSVGWLLPTGRLVMVDIDGRFGSTYGTTRSISTVGSVTPTENYGRYRRSVRFIAPRNWSTSTTSVGSYEKKIGRRSMSKWTHSKKLKKSVDIEFAYPYFTMSVRVA